MQLVRGDDINQNKKDQPSKSELAARMVFVAFAITIYSFLFRFRYKFFYIKSQVITNRDRATYPSPQNNNNLPPAQPVGHPSNAIMEMPLPPPYIQQPQIDNNPIPGDYMMVQQPLAIGAPTAPINGA